MKMYHVKDLLSQTLMESGYPKVKMGYPKYLMECISRRTFLESSVANSSMLNRVADKVVSELTSKGAVDPMAFNALVAFDTKVEAILGQLMGYYRSEKDPVEKKKIADMITRSEFLSDGILKKALDEAKRFNGNKLAKFISVVASESAAKSNGSPIKEFKAQVTKLRDEVSKFFYEDVPFKSTLESYKKYLLGNEGIVSTMDHIVDSLMSDDKQIEEMAPVPAEHKSNNPAGFQKGMAAVGGLNGALSDFKTHHRFEAQQAFLEAFAESMDYFSRKI